jgi:hypothetical protein
LRNARNQLASSPFVLASTNAHFQGRAVSQ